jgi:RHS repeat-associated protein
MPGAAGTQTRMFTYDKRGFLRQEQNPEIGVNGNGTTTYSDHDARGHVGKKVISSTIDLRFEYDGAERLIAAKDGTMSGRPLQLFSWDCIRPDVADPCTTATHPGQLAATARYNYDSVLGTIAVTQANQYDAATGLLLRRDLAVGSGVVGSETRFTGEDFFLTQNHNDFGLLETMTYPCRSVSGVCLSSDPGRTIQHGYAKGHLKSAGAWASDISYRPNGMIDTVTHGTGNSATVEQGEADPDGMTRPRRIYSTNANGTQELWSSGNYEFDGSGNVKKIGNTSYFYDGFGRLNGWSVTNPLGPNSGYSTTSREYDAFGNHLYTTEEGCRPMPNPVCYTNSVLARDITGTTNHYADTSYDAAGNVVLDNTQRAYTWDPLGMMTGATVNGRPFRFLYDADNERIAAVERVPVGATRRNRTTFTLRGPSNQLLSTWTDDWTGGTSVFTRKEDTIWRGSQVLARADGTDTMNYTPDHLGSPRLITDGAGEVLDVQNFDPFGSGGLLGSGALQFTGHERDQANIGGGTYDLPDYMHARFYDKNGRFLSVDPIPGEVHTPQSWNAYAYARSNPLRYTDPSGLILHVMSQDAADDLCTLVGPDCNAYVQIADDGKVTITATAADLENNAVLDLINDMVTSPKKYGAWVGATMPSGDRMLMFGPRMGDNRVVNLSTTARTDIPPALNLPLPEGFDGAVGIYRDYASIAVGQDGRPVSRAMLLFHEMAENYHRTEKIKQYLESHQNAITRENLLRLQRPDLDRFAPGAGPNSVTIRP